MPDSSFITRDDASMAPYACHPSQSRGRQFAEPEAPTRSPFQRDRDRVIHSGAFRKLQYKTQVFVYHEGDYYRTRLTHSLEVAQIARSICRVLRLNEDLAEALALAHDLGHTCFGHAGEDALHECMRDHGGFDHNGQALRIVTLLERRYAAFDGLNLTWETLEGLVKHNGPISTNKLVPAIAEFNATYDLELDGHASAEAQVAALSDDIAYNNHDLDDGIRAGFITFDQLRDLPLTGDALRRIETEHANLEPSRLIHEMTRSTINRMVSDLLQETGRRLAALAPETAADIRAADAPVAAFSPELLRYDKTLRQFLMTNMYRHYKVNRMTSHAKRVVRDLFDLFNAEPECLPPDWRALAGQSEAQPRLIADYIAGMTDRYALKEHHRLFDLYSPAL